MENKLKVTRFYSIYKMLFYYYDYNVFTKLSTKIYYVSMYKRCKIYKSIKIPYRTIFNYNGTN